MSDTKWGSDLVTDFEDGIDAIEFLIASFSFGRLRIPQDGDDTTVNRSRLADIDADALRSDAPVFTPPD